MLSLVSYNSICTETMRTLLCIKNITCVCERERERERAIPCELGPERSLDAVDKVTN